MTDLSIIVLSYNTRGLTINCLNSLMKQYKDEINSLKFEIIIVDNNSTDKTIEEVKKINNKNISIIENKDNVGFSKGNNIAAAKSKGKYLLFLNSDTETLDRGFISVVENMEEDKRIGVSGIRLINIDGSQQKSAGKFYTIFNTFLMLFGGGRLGLLRFSPKDGKIVDWVSGAALFIRRDLFEKIKGFDENLFMYMEDMELCYRVNKQGLKVLFLPVATVAHKERGSSDKSFAITGIYKGILYFYRKHSNFLIYNIIKVLLFIKAFLAIFIGFLTGKKALVNTYKKAINF